MENQEDKTKVYLIGGAIITVGILLLASLLNLVNSASIYGLALPLLLLVAGFTMVSAQDKSFYNATLGVGFLLAGLVSLLVRFNVISGKVVNAILGVVLLLVGIMVFVRIADKHAVKKTNS